MKLTIDFETRSAVDLKSCGAWVYSEDETTDIICLALKADDQAPRIFVNQSLFWVMAQAGLNVASQLPLIAKPEVEKLLAQADIIEAHNAEFETAMWQNCLVRKYGFAPLPLDKLRCSLAKASYHSLPRGLGDLCKVLDVEIQKDSEGHKLMLKLCRPKRLVRAELEPIAAEYGMDWKTLKALQGELYERLGKGFPRFEWPNRVPWDALLHWHEDPNEILRVCQYCLTDVEAEHAASEAMADLPERELRAWRLDQVINARGLGTDPALVDGALGMISEYTERLLDELATLTNGEVQTPKQTAKYLARVNAALPEEKHLQNMQAATVKAALADKEIKGEARRLLEIRKALALSSTAKYEAMKDRASADGRIRGSLLYHGASTGRWSGRGIQPQNLPRGKVKDTAVVVDLLRGGETEMVMGVWPDPMSAASSCIRGVFTPAPEKEFTCADYSNIEGRVVAWLAGEEWKVQAFRDYDTIVGKDAKGKPIRKGHDLYKLAYAKSFGIAVQDVTDEQRQIGKVEELSLGFQGGPGAFEGMAKNYGVELPAEVIKEIIAGWRQAHPMVCALWKGLDEASIMAVSHPEKAYGYRAIVYKMSRCGRYLLCKLPSGRLLHYPYPNLEPAEMPWGETKTVVTYYGVDSTTGKWAKNKLYGGLATENCFTAETQVFTQSGVKPLISVTPEDLVWDGIGWVEHEGLLYQGEKEVHEWAGVRMTPDQLVLASRWTPLNELDENTERECLDLGRGKLVIVGEGAKKPKKILTELIGPREVYDLVNCGPRNRFTILTDKGPVIVHNCVQAIARDIMLEGMFAVEAAGYETVLTVHDELLTEHPVGFGSLDEFCGLISANPPWSAGLPISAAGWRGNRYRKG